MRKLIALALSIVLIFTFPLSVSAVNEANSNHSSEESYLSFVLPIYLSRYENYSGGELSITQGYEIQNAEQNSHIYFIFEEDTYIANLLIGYSNGRYHSSFSFDENESLDALVPAETPFALVRLSTENLSLIWNGGHAVFSATPLSGNFSRSLLLPEIELVQPERMVIPTNEMVQPLVDVSRYYAYCGVNIVGNEISDEGQGLCWAACVASAINYKNNTTWGAYSLYRALKTHYESHYDATPYGILAWYRAAYEYNDLSVVTSSSVPTWGTIYSALNSDRPFILRVNNGSLYHDVIIRQFIGSDGYIIFYLMDPNEDDFVLVILDDVNLDMNNFVYDAGYCTYSDIHGYVY